MELTIQQHRKGLLKNTCFLNFEMFLFLMFNGSASQLVFNKYAMIPLALVNVLIIMHYKMTNSFRKYIPYVLIIVFFNILQFVFVERPEASLSLFVRIIYGATVLILFSNSFRMSLLNMMYILSAIGLILWLLYITTGFYFSLIDMPYATTNHSMLIFATRIDERYLLKRNNGCFGEPGLHACYIILTLLLFLHDFKKQYHIHKKKFVILILALLSSQSTTGFIVFGVFVCLVFLLSSKKNFVSGLFTVIILVSSFYYLGTEFGILGDKVKDQVEDINLRGSEYRSSRTGSLMYDLTIIQKHPIVGNGFNEEQVFGSKQLLEAIKNNEIMANGNGFSNILLTMGIPFFLIWIYMFYRNNQNFLHRKVIVSIILILILVLQGEPLFNYTLMCIFPFINYKIQV